jgi:hypothetical protein
MRAVEHDGDPQRAALVWFARFGDEDPTHRARFDVLRMTQERYEEGTPRRTDAFDPVYARGSLPAILLGHPTYCQAASRPGFHQQTLETMHDFDIARLRGSVNAAL